MSEARPRIDLPFDEVEQALSVAAALGSLLFWPEPFGPGRISRR